MVNVNIRNIPHGKLFLEKQPIFSYFSKETCGAQKLM
jgi:hypothetical protein